MKDNQCIFCKIVNKELPAEVVYEDKSFLAFSTIEPVSRGHTLVIPKEHYTNILDIEESVSEKLMGVSKNLAVKLVEANGASGVNLLHAAGEDAQQSVFHFHLHIVPRYPNDNLDLWFRSKL